MDQLLKSGKVKPTEKISQGTYRHLLHDNQYGEKGWIDLNVIEKDALGNAVGIRAEELYKQYFPEEYFKALREAQALAEQTGTKAQLKITRTQKNYQK